MTENDESKVAVWRVRPKEGGSWLIDEKLENLAETLNHEVPVGQEFTLERIEMTRQELATMGSSMAGKMKFGLVFASGPTPREPRDARTLGYEERKLDDLIEQNNGEFRMYCHATSIPELVAIVRTLGRDCSYECFAETQALLHVRGAS